MVVVDGGAEPTNPVAFPLRSVRLLHSNRLLRGLRGRLGVYVLTRRASCGMVVVTEQCS